MVFTSKQLKEMSRQRSRIFSMLSRGLNGMLGINEFYFYNSNISLNFFEFFYRNSCKDMGKEAAMQAYLDNMKKVMETAPYDNDIAQTINLLIQ